MNIPSELLEQLGKGNVILFCGAGISASATGLPSGAQLAHELAERAGLADVSGMTLPEVAQAYALEMGLQSLIAYITSRVDDPRYRPLHTHHLIAALPFKRIITTNWDNLLEEALRQAGRPFVKAVRDTDIAYIDEEKVLLIKLHGSIEQKDTLVITGDDYYDVFARRPETANLVRSYFATKTLLFLGFGLADEDFKRLYHEVVRHLGKHKRRAYAVQLAPSPLTVKYWEQKNVQIIAGDVTDFLEALTSKLTVRHARRVSIVAPRSVAEPSTRPPKFFPTKPFEDDFNGTVIRSDLWQVYENGGRIEFDDGKVHLSTSRGRQFPFIHSRYDPFEGLDNFTVRVSLEYPVVRVRGVGFVLSQECPKNGLSEQEKNSPRYQLFSIWQDEHNGLKVYFQGYRPTTGIGKRIFRTPQTNIPYTFELRYVKGTYTLLVNGTQEWIGRSSERPTVIWFGNPTDQGEEEVWSEIKVDSVQIEPVNDVETEGTTEQPTADVRDVRRRQTRPGVGPGPIRSRWALLVGVNHYVDPAFPPLKFCINDVLALERQLGALGYTVVALHDDATEERLLPTRDNVEAELAQLCQVAGPDDLLLAHFACHGKLVDGRPVLITRETRAPTLAEKALPLADVERRMRESEARRLVLTLDACHTGVEIGRDLADPEFIRNAYELAEGFALIAASTAQQVAQEWQAKEHGVFTYHLLDGLSGKADRDGKGFVTVDDIKTHVLDGLRRWNVEHGGLLQEPTARTEGLGDIIVADYRAEVMTPLPGREQQSQPTSSLEDRAPSRDEMLRAKILQTIREHPDEAIGASQIAQKLGYTTEEIVVHLEILEMREEVKLNKLSGDDRVVAWVASLTPRGRQRAKQISEILD